MEAGPAIDDLPPHVASSILGLLPFEERHRAPPLVCSRWRALVAASPELRREVALFLPSRRVLAGLRALAAWLRRGAAADVQRMRLCLHAPLPGTDAASQAALADSPASADEEQRAGEALADALAGLLAACSGPASALRQLDLSIEAAPLVVARQLAAALQGLPHLQRLSIGLHRYGGLRLATPLAGLPALRALSLSASPEPMPPLHPSEAATSEDGALQARCRQRGLQYCCGGAACVSDGHAAAVGLEVLRAEHPCFVALLQNAALPRGLTRLCLSGLAGLSLPEEVRGRASRPAPSAACTELALASTQQLGTHALRLAARCSAARGSAWHRQALCSALPSSPSVRPLRSWRCCPACAR